MSDSLPAECLHGILATYWHERGNWLYGCWRTYFLLTVTLVVPKLLSVLSFAFQGLAYTFIFSAQNPKTQRSVFGDLKWESTVDYIPPESPFPIFLKITCYGACGDHLVLGMSTTISSAGSHNWTFRQIQWKLPEENNPKTLKLGGDFGKDLCEDCVLESIVEHKIDEVYAVLLYLTVQNTDRQ